MRSSHDLLLQAAAARRAAPTARAGSAAAGAGAVRGPEGVGGPSSLPGLVPPEVARRSRVADLSPVRVWAPRSVGGAPAPPRRGSAPPRPKALRGTAGTKSASLKGDGPEGRSRPCRETTWSLGRPSRLGTVRHSGALTEPRGEGRGARPPRAWDSGLGGGGGRERAAGGRRGRWGKSDSFAFFKREGSRDRHRLSPTQHTHTPRTHTQTRKRPAGASGMELRKFGTGSGAARAGVWAAAGWPGGRGVAGPASGLLTSVLSAAFSAIFLLRSKQREECFMPIRASEGLVAQ